MGRFGAALEDLHCCFSAGPYPSPALPCDGYRHHHTQATQKLPIIHWIAKDQISSQSQIFQYSEEGTSRFVIAPSQFPVVTRCKR